VLRGELQAKWCEVLDLDVFEGVRTQHSKNKWRKLKTKQ